MDILIKGLSLPKKGHCTIVAVFSDGSVDYRDREEMAFHRTTAVALPEHGDLKNFNDILTVFDKVIHDVDDDTNALLCDLLVQIQNAPAVVEASNG